MQILRWIVASVASLALLSSAHAQDASRARLATAIDPAAFSDHFPVVALARGVSGRAVLNCDVAADGGSQCSVAEETPAGMGFGAAAASLAQGWRFTPKLENGQAVASTARVPVAFQNPSNQSVPIGPDLYVDATRGAASLTTASGDELARFYPERARQSAASGRALVACAVRSGRRVECGLEREAPDGWGFGQAAVEAATRTLSQQRLRPGDRTRVVVDFAVHGSNEPAAVRNFWENEPTGADYLRFIPGRALETNAGGRVLLDCAILTGRTLDCGVASETPRDQGYGAAAVQLSRRYKFRANEMGRPGHAVGDHIILPIVFRMN